MSEIAANIQAAIARAKEATELAEAQRRIDFATPEQRAQWEHEIKMIQAARSFEYNWKVSRLFSGK